MNTNDTKFLNGLRFILALWVGLGHFYQHIGAEQLFKFPLSSILKANGSAVDGFMLITGFLMMFHYNESLNSNSFRPTFQFYSKRFFRLYPVYFFIIIAGYLSFPLINTLEIQMHSFFFNSELSNMVYSKGRTVGLGDLISHLTMIHGIVPDYNESIILPAWSLSTEIQFYFLFPFLVPYIQKNKNLIILIIVSTILYWFCNRLLGVWEQPGILTNFGAPSFIFQKMIYFSIGISLAQFKLYKSKISLVLFNLLMIAFISITPLSTALCILITILFVAEDLIPYLPKPINNCVNYVKILLSGKETNFGANISYSFYLIHFTMIPLSFWIAMQLGNYNKGIVAIISFMIFIILSIGISQLLYLTIEKPFIKIGKRSIKQ